MKSNKIYPLINERSLLQRVGIEFLFILFKRGIFYDRVAFEKCKSVVVNNRNFTRGIFK